MEIMTDIIVVGAGTAGIYFGWKMAQKGFKVIIIDKSSQEKLGTRLDSFHVDSDKFEEFGVEPPHEGDAELITTFDRRISKSPFDHYPKVVYYPFHVMRHPIFLARLTKLAKEAKAQVQYETKFIEFLFEDGKIVGISAERAGENIKYKAKLVVDAAGMHTPVRSSLPEGYGIENFEIADNEQFYVILRYINWKNREQLMEEKDNGWTYYKTWIAPAPEGSDAVLGIGQPLSYDKGEEVLKDFLNTVEIPEYDIVKFERGSTPYRRSPFSMVADGILILGDAACLTKPFSGEGITSGWTLAKIAIEEITKLPPQEGIYTKNQLWPINTRYQCDQGAKFSELLSQIPAAANTLKKENEYLFKKDIIFSAEDLTSMNRDFQMNLTTKKLVKIVGLLIWGLLSGNYTFKNLKSLVGALGTSGKIRTHYANYPQDPAKFEEWKATAIKLWAKVPKMQ